ncbi:dihydrofolate reductase [Candidatus Woesebacteria bacterium]|nr:dihydrofolate reductase [Candidatus Woesebacteria bacterium]
MHVFLLAAISADGYIDQGQHQASTAWTSPEDKKFFVTRTREAKILVMGRRTFETIGHGLPGRKIYVLSSSAKPEVYAHLNDDSVEYTSDALETLIEKLRSEDVAEVAICGGASIYSQALEKKLVNTVYLTLEPIIFGEGIKLCPQASSTALKLKHVVHLSDQTILLEYAVL